MAALFDIKNVSYPATIKTKTAFKATGDVTLFNIPFFLLLWVAVTVTYPKKWWEVIGSPETASVAIAKLGKFEVEFPDGFDREGDYTIDVRAFLGPTVITNIGFISSASVTIPPFPSVVILPQKQFSVSGEGGGTGQALAFNMGNPTINPSTVEIGEQTAITLPVKNVGTNPQTFTVQIDITEMGATGISPPGKTVGSQTFGPYTLQPGATQNVVFSWTATGTAKGKWLVTSVLVNDELAPNTTPNNPTIFKQEFEIVSPVVSFQLLNPVISPTAVMPGQTTSITFDVVNNSTHAQVVKLHADITEMGATGTSPPGTTVDSYDNQATIQPGQHWNPVWTWTAKGANTGKWIVVSLKDSSDILTPNTGPNNPNIFKQEFEVVAPSISFQLLNPTIDPADVPLGQTTQITFEVVNNSNTAQIVKLHAEVHEMGATSSSPPGSQVGPSYDPPQYTIQPGETWQPTWSWLAAGAPKGKWLVVSLLDASGKLMPNTGPNNPNIFKQEFEVLPAGGGAEGFVTKQSVVYNSNQSNINSGQPISVQITWKNTGTTGINPRFRVDIQGTGFLDTPLEGEWVASPVVSPGQTVVTNASSIPIPTDWPNGKTLHAYLMLDGVNGHWDESSILFTVVVPTVIPTGYIAGPVEANYGSEYRNEALPIAIQTPGQTIEFVFGIQNTSASAQQLGATVVVTKPDGSVMNLKYGPTSISSNNGVTVKLTSTSTITTAGSYRVDVRLWYGQDDSAHLLDSVSFNPGFTVAGGGGAATLNASHSGGVLSYSFSGFQPNATVTLTVVETGGYLTKTANASGAGSGSFNDNDPAGNYTLRAADSYGHSATATFTISGGGGAATLSASHSGGVLSYSFSGFQPNATVTLTVVETGGYLTKTANASGAGSGSFNDNDPAGTYTLRAADSYGHSATATFTISGGGGAATLNASYSGGICSYSFSGFQPNATVTLTVTQTGGYITATANATGSGSGSFYDNDPAGTYTLRAADSYGHSATATFTKT